MRIEVFADADAVARAGAAIIAAEARKAVAASGRFSLAVSGGRAPRLMFRALADADVPWQGLHLFQVDERVAPAGHADRNLTSLQASLLAHCPLRAEQFHPMPVEATDLDAAAAGYAKILEEIAGTPAKLDLVHLGLGADGHTASLVPGDPVLAVIDRDVAVSGVYQARRRMTLTYPVLNRSGSILWLATGSEKAAALARLVRGDPSIPAGRVRPERAVLLADGAAAAGVDQAPGR
jgi:6-phosphogluconolactonase